MEYSFSEIETKWRKAWADTNVYKVRNDSTKPKCYVLDMFPYPSGEGLHVGHPLGYIASDIYARYKRHKGFNVLHPMGYDSFGLPAEQYAIQTGVHPSKTIEKAIATYRSQLDQIGLSFDWSREVRTSDSSYYKWTQHIFRMMFDHYFDTEAQMAKPISELVERFEVEGTNVAAHNSLEKHLSAEEWKSLSAKERDEVLMNFRLMYRKVSFVNWCEALGTVLANDEVKDGVSERGGHPVVQKPMMQWSMRITAYGQRLLDGLDTVEFSEAIKTQQRNWIGRSEGAKVNFKVAGHDAETIEIFTTRPDTMFGATFMVLCPEHDLIDKLTTPEQRLAVDVYLEYTGKRSERDRQAEVKNVTGVFTGAFAKNPFSGKDIPIWISEYVLAGYGTGAIMAVPAHDERDNRFAKHFGLDIIQVIQQPEGASIEEKVGKMMNSGSKDGLKVIGNNLYPIINEIPTTYDIVTKNSGNLALDFFNKNKSKSFGTVETISSKSEQHIEKITIKTFQNDNQAVQFIVLCPDDNLVDKITTTEKKQAVINYKKGIALDRQSMPDVFTGAYAINRLNGDQIPIWISQDVLLDSSPQGSQKVNAISLNGLEVKEAISKILGEIESRNIGIRKVNYKLRDANFSRQRYWGEPFPIYYDKDGVAYTDYELPVVLPVLDNYKPTEDGKAPLARATDWVNSHADCTREIDTMPGFAGSSWYFLRYMDPQNAEEFASQKAINYWQQVDLYVGGAEHAVGHLLYSRTWHKFLKDKGLVPTEEPFKKLVNQGMIQGVIESICLLKDSKKFVSAEVAKALPKESYALMPVHVAFVKNYGSEHSHLDAEGIEKFKQWRQDYASSVFETNADGKLVTVSEVGKMSKRYFNVINPDDVIAEYGADCFRLYEMFLGPLEQSKPWDTNGIEGCHRFLRKMWGLYFNDGKFLVTEEKPSPEALKALHTCIKKIGADIEALSLNTCVSAFMICVNELARLNARNKEVLLPLAVLVSPFAPFMAEELWHLSGGEGTVFDQAYPMHNDSYLVETSFVYPICVNGKRRTELTFEANADKASIMATVMQNEVVLKWLEGATPKNIIVVPNKMVNIVY